MLPIFHVTTAMPLSGLDDGHSRVTVSSPLSMHCVALTSVLREFSGKLLIELEL